MEGFVVVLQEPACEPVTLAEMRDYLRVAGDQADDRIAALIKSARERIETVISVAMISRRLRVTLDRWPHGTVERRALALPVRPSEDLSAVRVFNAAGTPQDATYRFTLAHGRSARLVWTSGAFPWPGQRENGIEIDYVAGFGDGPEDVAEGLRLAVKRLVAYAWHGGEISDPLPEDVAGLVSPWRRAGL